MLIEYNNNVYLNADEFNILLDKIMILKKEKLLSNTINSEISELFVVLYNMIFYPNNYPYVKIIWSSNYINNTNKNKKYIHVPGLSTNIHPSFCNNMLVHMYIVSDVLIK